MIFSKIFELSSNYYTCCHQNDFIVHIFPQPRDTWLNHRSDVFRSLQMDPWVRLSKAFAACKSTPQELIISCHGWWWFIAGKCMQKKTSREDQKKPGISSLCPFRSLQLDTAGGFWTGATHPWRVWQARRNLPVFVPKQNGRKNWVTVKSIATNADLSMALSARLIRLCCEVTKEVDLTESLALGPAMRSLQLGEILEVRLGSS